MFCSAKVGAGSRILHYERVMVPNTTKRRGLQRVGPFLQFLFPAWRKPGIIRAVRLSRKDDSYTGTLGDSGCLRADPSPSSA